MNPRATDNIPGNIVEVLLPLAVGSGFDYRVPAGVEVSPGDFVSVPFGRKEMVGVVWGKGVGGVPETKMKSLLARLDHMPPMSHSTRDWIDWIAWYTVSPRGAVLKLALPSPDLVKPLDTRKQDFHPSELVLLSAQAVAASTLATKIRAGHSVTLLDGVTGSGKTEVYFDTIAHILAGGAGQVLVLVPEIALTLQWLGRFEKRFGTKPYLWHSGLTPRQRRDCYQSVARGDARVVVGARSALFLPFLKLELIVVDEEHESSYKQEDGVHYHARDMAVARAHREDIPIVLVSATPALETLQNVGSGKYAEVRLPDRFHGTLFPEVELVDMRLETLRASEFLSPPLRAALVSNLAHGNQSLLFLNRRGYAPLVLCRACGHRFQCPHCSSWLVMHRGPARLQCHHCGYGMKMPDTCPACKAEGKLHACGPGVERLAEEVASFLPEARLCVLTSEHAAHPKEALRLLDSITQREVDIIIGTQIMAKGHHFPGLQLVGVVDADLGLAGGDLRAGEKTYQLLHQISGRAGREEGGGRVIVQSYLPDHPAIQALVAGDRNAFMALEASYREESAMPPFGRLVAIIIEGKKKNEVEAYARELASRAPHSSPNTHHSLLILGPAPAPLALLRGWHRMRFLIKAPRKMDVQKLVADWLATTPAPRTLKIKVDVDPYSFL